MKVDIDKENNSVFIYKTTKDHIGISETIRLIGCEIIIDRTKNGRV